MDKCLEYLWSMEKAGGERHARLSMMAPRREIVMQTLRLKRTTFTDKSTIGELYMPDGVFQCFTLEDRVRDHKIAGETAIPAGRYQIVVDFSNRFQRLMPLLLNVPFYRGIRIHNGNTPAHTEGCLLVGRKAGEDRINESIPAFDDLFPKIRKMVEAGKLFIEIEGGFKAEDWKQEAPV